MTILIKLIGSQLLKVTVLKAADTHKRCNYIYDVKLETLLFQWVSLLIRELKLKEVWGICL